MNSRDVINCNFEGNDKIRPGLNFDRGRINDFAGCSVTAADFTQKRWDENGFEYYDDEWGNLWRRLKTGCHCGEICKPAIDEWKKLDEIVLPNYTEDICYENIRQAYLSTDEEKFRLVGMPGWVFERARYLRNMDTYLMDMIDNTDKLDVLHTFIANILSGIIDKAAEIKADAIFFCEDMGTQENLLFGPEMWRHFFRDIYSRLFGKVHDYGMKVVMHSCGYNWDILPDLISAGVNCFQFDQPLLYDTKKLSEFFKAHNVVLWSPVDIQRVMPTGNRELIENSAREMVQAYKGRLICKNYSDLAGIGVKEEWDDWAYDAICQSFEDVHDDRLA